jgi:hypothetical protein
MANTTLEEERLADEPARAERGRLLARVAFEAIWERDVQKGTFAWLTGLSMFGYAPEEVVDTAS